MWTEEPVSRRSRQPIGEIGGKGGGKDDQVGYDAGKKVKGRKIHALVDTEGLPMRVVVHSAAIQDRDGAGCRLHEMAAEQSAARGQPVGIPPGKDAEYINKILLK